MQFDLSQVTVKSDYNASTDGLHIRGLVDSKTLDESQREYVFKLLCSDPRISFASYVVDHHCIDKINILAVSVFFVVWVF